MGLRGVNGPSTCQQVVSARLMAPDREEEEISNPRSITPFARLATSLGLDARTEPMDHGSVNRWAAKLAALDANLLVALDAVLHEGNVTRAAARVGITQSAMSQTLGRLREHFDDPILVRVGRQMQPTPFASRVRGRLRAAISELEAVVCDRPDFDPSRASRRFVLAMVDYLALLLMPRLQHTVQRLAPDVDLAVHALDADAITPQLEAGTVDLYVGVQGTMERGLTTQSLFRDPLVVVVRPDHPLLSAALTPEHFVLWPHLQISPRREGRSLVGHALAARGLDRRIAIEVPYFTLAPSLLRDSDLIATCVEFIRNYGCKTGERSLAELDFRTPIALP